MLALHIACLVSHKLVVANNNNEPNAPIELFPSNDVRTRLASGLGYIVCTSVEICYLEALIILYAMELQISTHVNDSILQNTD